MKEERIVMLRTKSKIVIVVLVLVALLLAMAVILQFSNGKSIADALKSGTLATCMGAAKIAVIFGSTI